MATVVFDVWADVPALNIVRATAVTLVKGLMNNSLGTRWIYRAAIEVKVSVEAGVCREFELASVGSKNINGNVALMHEAVPFGRR